MYTHMYEHATHTHSCSSMTCSTQQGIRTIGPPTHQAWLDCCIQVSGMVHGILRDIALGAKENDEEFRSKETDKDSKSIHYNGQ